MLRDSEPARRLGTAPDSDSRPSREGCGEPPQFHSMHKVAWRRFSSAVRPSAQARSCSARPQASSWPASRRRGSPYCGNRRAGRLLPADAERGRLVRAPHNRSKRNTRKECLRIFEFAMQRASARWHHAMGPAPRCSTARSCTSARSPSLMPYTRRHKRGGHTIAARRRPTTVGWRGF
jgi:hypothetical protein